MAYAFDWEKLPLNMRMGKSPGEELVLYRGYRVDQLDPERGMLSDAVRTDDLSSIERVVSAVESGDIYELNMRVAEHAFYKLGSDPVTPFVSSTTNKRIARGYAMRPSERVAKLIVKAEQVLMVPQFSYEALILGSVSVASVIERDVG